MKGSTVFWCFVGTAIALGKMAAINTATHPSTALHPPAAAAPARPVVKTYAVPIERVGRMSFVRAQINGQDIRFLLDTGSTSVCLPDGLITVLRARGALKDTDYRGKSEAWVADGRKRTVHMWNLRWVDIGEWNVNDVAASSCGKGDDPLLGQTLLTRFASVSIDNNRSALLLTAIEEHGSR